MNIRFILYVLGVLLLIEGGLLALTAMVALQYGEHDLLPILYSSAFAFGIGGLCWYLNKNCSKEIGKREGFIIVSTVWIVFAFFGAFPFIVSGYIPSVTDAFFEAMSGFTTTGATILMDIEILPHGLLFWRALMHFTGGIGILVLCIAVLPVFGVGSMNIFKSEISTALGEGRFSPRIKDTAKLIFRIYIVLTALCTLLYLLDMSFFDAICHAFSTTATGGFSTKNAGVSAFPASSQYITILFMLLGSCSFILFFHAWKREFGKIMHNDEFRFYLKMILITFIIICVGLLINGYPIEQALREGLFNVVSMMSTTGYAMNDYLQWSPPLWFILFVVSFIGGCAGSTSSGLKVVRFMLLVKMIPVQFKRIMHQNAIIQVKQNKKNVSEEIMFRTLAFFMIFLCVFAAGVFMLMICGLNVTSAIGASVSCLANTGTGFDFAQQGNTFAGLSVAGKWVCSFLMLIGRLELYSILILFSSAFWRSHN